MARRDTIFFMTEEILAHYKIGSVERVHPIENGLINKTFSVHAAEGIFILQRLAKIFDERAILDMQAVTEHLTKKGVPTPVLLQMTDGAWFVKDDEGFSWKLMTAVPGEIVNVVADAEMAFEAGRVLGQFHEALRDFDPAKLQSPFRLHDSRAVYDNFRSKRVDLPEAQFIRDEMPKHLLPANLPTTVVHGDPKISNVIFKDGKGVAMIDLDTCMPATVLVDLGDAFRSWCGGIEDDPENKFDVKKFEAGLAGYSSVAPLRSDEQAHLHDAIVLITLELAARFASDIVDDSYFGWNKQKYASRREHNTARVRSMVALAKSIIAAIPALRASFRPV